MKYTQVAGQTDAINVRTTTVFCRTDVLTTPSMRLRMPSQEGEESAVRREEGGGEKITREDKRTPPDRNQIPKGTRHVRNRKQAGEDRKE